MEVDEGSIGEHLGREQIGDQEKTYWAEGTGKEKKRTELRLYFHYFWSGFRFFRPTHLVISMWRGLISLARSCSSSMRLILACRFSAAMFIISSVVMSDVML